MSEHNQFNLLKAKYNQQTITHTQIIPAGLVLDSLGLDSLCLVDAVVEVTGASGQ